MLEKIIMQNERIVKTLKVLEAYAKENSTFKNHYLAAGGINQTVLITIMAMI